MFRKYRVNPTWNFFQLSISGIFIHLSSTHPPISVGVTWNHHGGPRGKNLNIFWFIWWIFSLLRSCSNDAGLVRGLYPWWWWEGSSVSSQIQHENVLVMSNVCVCGLLATRQTEKSPINSYPWCRLQTYMVCLCDGMWECGRGREWCVWEWRPEF